MLGFGEDKKRAEHLDRSLDDFEVSIPSSESGGIHHYGLSGDKKKKKESLSYEEEKHIEKIVEFERKTIERLEEMSEKVEQATFKLQILLDQNAKIVEALHKSPSPQQENPWEHDDFVPVTDSSSDRRLSGQGQTGNYRQDHNDLDDPSGVDDSSPTIKKSLWGRIPVGLKIFLVLVALSYMIPLSYKLTHTMILDGAKAYMDSAKVETLSNDGKGKIVESNESNAAHPKRDIEELSPEDIEAIEEL